MRRLLVVIVAVALTACANDDLVIVFDTTTTSPSTTSDVTTSPSITTTTIAGYGDQVRSVVVDGVALPAFVDSHTDPAIGQAIPTLIGEDYDGTPITIGPDRTNPMLIVVLAHWCPHCNNEIPEINAIRDADRWPDGLEVVGISSAIAPDRPNFPPARWLVEKDWTYPVLADGIDEARGVYIAGDALGVTGYPFMVLVDATGAVRGRWSGESPADALVALVTDLINPQADV